MKLQVCYLSCILGYIVDIMIILSLSYVYPTYILRVSYVYPTCILRVCLHQIRLGGGVIMLRGLDG